MAAREKWGYESERLVFYNLEENSAVATVRDRLQLEGARAKVAGALDKGLAAGNRSTLTTRRRRLCHNVLPDARGLTPSPVSPRLMKAPVASHPLPQGGEGK